MKKTIGIIIAVIAVSLLFWGLTPLQHKFNKTNNPNTSIRAVLPPNSSTEQYCGKVKVYSNNGYYVKAKNTGNKAYEFSFRYETVGYNVSNDESQQPVYTEVSRTTDEYKNVTIEAQEERNLFTAPQDNNKKTVYYIRVLEVFYCNELK